MSSPTERMFGTERIEWFDGNLFDGAEAIPLEATEIEVLRDVAKLDWAQVEPAIFGTLFERGLDPTGGRSSAPTTPTAPRSSGSSSRS